MKLNKNNTIKISFLVSFWMMAAIFYIFLEMALENYIVTSYRVSNYSYNLPRVLIIALSVTLFAGTILASFEILFFNRQLSKKSFGTLLIIKSFFYLTGIFVFTSIGTIISASFILNKSIFHFEVYQRFIQYISSPKIWAEIIYWSIVIFLSLFILNISEKLGQGVLINYILGKYHSPKEDRRIFMFIDLTSSSTYAERLGHVKYSRLIQDCFFDITSVVNKRCVQIYQYVGDEIVLTWNTEKGLFDNNCLKTFFEFEESIKERSDYYLTEYGLVPEFKAGANFGYVTIAEVGEMKKELAYHGDAINTAAHIRSECGKLKKKLLVSADLLSLMPNVDDQFITEPIGVCQLKGKKNIIGLFSVEPK